MLRAEQSRGLLSALRVARSHLRPWRLPLRARRYGHHHDHRGQCRGRHLLLASPQVFAPRARGGDSGEGEEREEEAKEGGGGASGRQRGKEETTMTTSPTWAFDEKLFVEFVVVGQIPAPARVSGGAGGDGGFIFPVTGAADDRRR